MTTSQSTPNFDAIQGACKTIISSIGEDPLREGLLKTPLGVAVVIQAKHLCMQMRGIEKQNSSVITSSMLGVFRDDTAIRSEFLNSLKSDF